MRVFVVSYINGRHVDIEVFGKKKTAVASVNAHIEMEAPSTFVKYHNALWLNGNQIITITESKVL